MAAMAKRVDVSDKGKYRKVDVDAIDEDQYRDEETEDSGQEQQVNQRAQEVRQLLSKGQVRDAVARALQAPPLGSKNQAVKDKNTEVVVGALTSAKAAEIGNIVRSLDADTLDVLMKYLYVGMASPEKYNATSLLAWHEEVVNAVGMASIVRVLTDRKTA